MITNSLKVLLWGKEIGRLSWDAKRGIGYFEYSRGFLEGNLDAFPLIASIGSPTSKRPIIGDKEHKIYHRLPPFIADSLPDAWGNQVFECWRIQQGIKNQEITPLDILSFIGKRGMGALEFIPESSGIKKSEKVHLQALIELAQRIFTQRSEAKIEPDESITLQSLIAVGTSAGGRQPKAIIAINPTTGEIRSGQIAGQKGFEYCILKFGDAERSSAELEMAYYEIATLAGIEMMPCRLIEVEGRRHFITLRFDRIEDCKVHMQTLAAIYPEADSYEKLMMVCRKMRMPESTQEEVFRRMIFNILANNTDDHNKNFSFLMNENGTWKLSPAYDLTYIFNTGGFLPETMHCLMMQGKLSRHTLDDAIQFARDNGIRRPEAIIRAVANALMQFRTIAMKHGVQPRWINAVEQTINAHLTSWGFANAGCPSRSFEIESRTFSEIRIEQTYKGNYHLYATENGKERKFVIGKNKPEHALIQETGITNISDATLCEMLKKYFL